ncbi:hypothetical protein FKW77_006855 [Venturia effusa]|uniref:ceramidase n=1 Tax=Venturia effusa TaxID=50376 RepID=A0A517LKF9_9PEZI|nr:hypothetical protein FKW77_006855 [Venturia effusa]
MSFVDYSSKEIAPSAAHEHDEGCAQLSSLATGSIAGEAPDVKEEVIQVAALVDRSGLAQEQVFNQKTGVTQASKSAQKSIPETPPTYTIDLSLPPAERYIEVATDYKEMLVNLPTVIEDHFKASGHSAVYRATKRLAKLFLRRSHSREQTEELRGISRASGVEMYLLVAINALADGVVFCTSGGVKVDDRGENNMFHFRTMEVNNNIIRALVVQFEYVEKLHGTVVARSIGHVGLVGILTGVRPGLSLSPNARECRCGPLARMGNVKYHGNRLAVLLGLRPSIASRLRKYLLPKEGRILPTLAEITSTFPAVTTTACYMIACDGDKTTVFEKDVNTATIRSDTTMITVTNHDQACECTDADGLSIDNPSLVHRGSHENSFWRKRCLEQSWKSLLPQRSSVRPEPCCINFEDVERLMVTHPTANSWTQFAAIMDPRDGKIAWCRRWLQPPVKTGSTGAV